MQLHEFSLFSQQAIARNPALAGASMGCFNYLVYLLRLDASLSVTWREKFASLEA